MKVETILDMIDLGSIALPEFQRGFVWNRDQVRGLMSSLYRRHPVGSLLVWVTAKDTATMRGGGNGNEGTVELLLDGQQRITTLYGIVRGAPPEFFDGAASAFTGLHFHLEDEVFEFYAPAKMSGNPLWVNVTELMKEGAGAAIVRLIQGGGHAEMVGTYATRLNRIDGVKQIELHIEKVTGQDKTIDVVVDIFNMVNSGGTKLSKGDLALAKVCAQWPAARAELKAALRRWSGPGFDFQMDWLLRNITTIATGKARFSELADIDTATFRQGLVNAESAANKLLNLIAARLGLDHDRVLGGRYAFPVMTRYLIQRGGKFGSAVEQDKLLYWYVNSFLWGRFTSSVETVLTKDLDLIDGTPTSLDRLIDQLRQSRGDLLVRPDDFRGWSLGARFYPMLYLLTRTHGARDLGGLGQTLSHWMLGKGSSLEVHHIFPKARLYSRDYHRSEVNALANFCFLTADTNKEISDDLPEKYFERTERNFPGALASQWIPLDEKLWKLENYRDFLAARRELLAKAANAALDVLLHAPATEELTQLDAELTTGASGPIVSEVLDPEVTELLAWIASEGIATPKLDLEIVSPDTQAAIVNADLAWPNGVQEGLGEPVAFELHADESVISALNAIGYRAFATVEGLRKYLETVIHPMTPEASESAAVPQTAVAEQFHRAMADVYRVARDEAGYNAARFLSMISEIGGLETAHVLLAEGVESEGFIALWERGRLDLTVEAHVLQPRFAILFSERELEVARRRLDDLGYDWRQPE
jgi:hypothetical protein